MRSVMMLPVMLALAAPTAAAAQDECVILGTCPPKPKPVRPAPRPPRPPIRKAQPAPKPRPDTGRQQAELARQALDAIPAASWRSAFMGDLLKLYLRSESIPALVALAARGDARQKFCWAMLTMAAMGDLPSIRQRPRAFIACC